MEKTKPRTNKNSCRKCGTANPPSNQYCKKCGAVLSVSTTMISAQRKPLLPKLEAISWKWVALGSMVILGMLAILGTLFTAICWLAIDTSARGGTTDLGGVVNEFIGFAIAGGTVILSAFGFSGIALAWLSRSANTKEPVIAASLVVFALGAFGGVVVTDILIVTIVLFIPAVALAGVGARLGLLFLPSPKERR